MNSNPFIRYRWYITPLILIMGVVFQTITSWQIQVQFPNRQPIFDTLFSILPYWPWLQNWSDIANVFSVILLAWYVFPRNVRKLPFILTVIGLAYFLRGIFIFLNPFGGPLGNITEYGLTNIHQYGQFPSGHTMITVLIYLIIDRMQSPWLKKLALISIFVEVAALLLSHGHYSIDIVGGFLVGYFAYHVLKPVEDDLISS